MAKASEDLPSPVDVYEAPSAPPPPPVPPLSYGPVYGPATYALPPRPTNVLAIIALIASCCGLVIPFGVVAGVIMGHISLSQIKRTGEGGHGLALAAVIVGYTVLALELLLVVVYVVFFVFVIGIASTASNFNFNEFG